MRWRCAGRALATRLPGYVVGTLGAYWTMTYLSAMVTR